MIDHAVLDLARRVTELERTQVRYRQGVVTATSPLSVTLGGSTVAYTSVKALVQPVALAVNDVVAVLAWGSDLIVLGRIP